MNLLQSCLRSELQKELDLIKKKNPRYSLRAMSRSLKLSSGMLSDFLKGKRSFSLSRIEIILSHTDLKLSKTRSLVRKLRTTELATHEEIVDHYPARDRTKIDEDQYAMIAEWHNYGILSLAKTADFVPEVEWIANRLGIAPILVEESLERLIRLRLLDGDEVAGFKTTGKSFTTSDGISSEILKKSQQENLELAGKSLFRDDVSIRDFCSMTMAVDPSKVDEVKRRVRSFMESISDLLENGERTEVYQAQFQLFPLTRRRQGRNS
ncbi:MAG TPA: DUF4423 domain-containing protein [Bdellovibrionota bacterium]|jgi:uncharacterized protein (TIGR02147 family)|nr:DUF4423 domain-containing protein [Bdellovibrionota bacterium]